LHPTVRPGHTFCTIEEFDTVARAVADCAFTASKLPILLSLEMHCSSMNQNRLAQSMVDWMGADLISVRCFHAVVPATAFDRCIMPLPAYLSPVPYSLFMQYDELCSLGQKSILSPNALTRRILVKGKIKKAVK
jgi:hypothetical protein